VMPIPPREVAAEAAAEANAARPSPQTQHMVQRRLGGWSGQQ
jgi:hypothetical protein